MDIKLARHQNECIDIIQEYENLGINRILICSPTGSGKTVMFGFFVSKKESEGKKILVLTDRRDLLNQTNNRFSDQFGIKPSIVKSGSGVETTSIDGYEFKTFIAMVDTLNNRLKNAVWQKFFSDFDYIIVDEAHEMRFSKIINNPVFENTTVIGFTATPVYSSRKVSMSRDYRSMCVLASENELINDGRLVYPMTVANEVDISNAKLKLGEYTVESQMNVISEFVPSEKVVSIYKDNCIQYVDYMKASGNQHYKEYEGKNLKAIYYGVDSNHCVELYTAFEKAGVKAGYILSNKELQSDTERRETVEAFINNEIEVLVNCMIATKGFDDPSILIVGKVFLTTSLAKDNQTSGRGSRPLVSGLHFMETAQERKDAIKQSKKPIFLIIDYLGNFERHGKWNDYKDWNRYFEGRHIGKGLPKKKEDELTESGKVCPKCENSVSPRSEVCTSTVMNPESYRIEICGYEFPKKEKSEKEGSYELIEEDDERFFYETKDMLLSDVFEIFEIYKAKRCKLKNGIKALNSKEEIFIFATLCEYNVNGWWNNYFRSSPPNGILERSEKMILDMVYEKITKLSKEDNSDIIEKAKAKIFKDEHIIKNSYKFIKML